MEQALSSLLVLVIDVNPVWWGQRTEIEDNQLQLCECVDTALVFANSHLMLSHMNKLAVIATHTDRSHFLYPSRKKDISSEGGGDAMATTSAKHDGKYEVFSQVDEVVRREIKYLISQNLEGEVAPDCIIAGALCMALCYINSLEKECPMGEKLSSRILVLKGAEDNPSQYMNFMNAVFTAQKQNVVIDACVLENDSGLLQQACDITGGIYLKVPQEAGLLQYLQWLFLTDPSTRGKLTLPPRAQVDYRAACFCHRTLIDVGYVCSVCLSGELYFPFKSLKSICYINALNVCCSKSTSYVAKWLYAVIWVCFFLGL
ncbi:general transcription factor IIH subunit 3-like isoform X2 [Pomacea canaliculata]|uniref:general transcription factor IIH subunit 3-like isoform X2 n=1 Tax=Pomacea canaliculata TaxID=400727 RepID=UPI000D72D884|nr:general transcription factor IIH subunit 3-like isoform X2 [Pomacea canaliculata]